MTDLSVDLAVLESARTSMRALTDEFRAIEDRHDADARAYGHDEVRDAMHEFTHNWHHHREQLVEKMDEGAEKITGTIDAFRDADQKLADELERNTTDEMPG